MEKKVFILVLNIENRMKIGREIRMLIAQQSYAHNTNISEKKIIFRPPSLVFGGMETGSKSIFRPKHVQNNQ